MWRLGRNILPTGVSLSKKGINLELECPLCHVALETAEHLFLECPYAKVMWFGTPLGIHISEHQNLQDWRERWLLNSDSLGHQYVCIGLWKLWKNRNNYLLNNLVFHIVAAVNEISCFLVDFNEANGVPDQKTRSQSTTVYWCAPPEVTLKINVNAAVCESKTGWGMLVRDFGGKVSFAAT